MVLDQRAGAATVRGTPRDAARAVQAADGRQLKYAAIGGELFEEGGWAASLIEAGLDPIIEQVSAPSVDRISTWAAESTNTFG